MAKFYGRGTGANRGYWELQWRDGKGRWIEMGSIGRYVKDGITYTGRMIGGDSADSINMERRTANGKIVEGVVDKINPKDFENLNVKALLDAPEGFTEEEVAQARRAENTRPIAASFPNGTKLSIDGAEHTKNDADTWEDSEGNSLSNGDIDSRMDEASDSSAQIPEEAELTAENILNATDGSVLSWNSKQYSRLDGKWFDEKTGKPVTDKTMRTKTDGDLSTEGGKESFTPTPASEYEPGTKLRAENDSGDDSADLEKTADNAWDVETGESSTSTDDTTTDRIIESADYLDDLSDFLQNPTESEPAPETLSASQVEEVEASINTKLDDLDVPKFKENEQGEDIIQPLTKKEKTALGEIRAEYEDLIRNIDAITDEDDKEYTAAIKEDALDQIERVDGILREEEVGTDGEDTPDVDTDADELARLKNEINSEEENYVDDLITSGDTDAMDEAREVGEAQVSELEEAQQKFPDDTEIQPLLDKTRNKVEFLRNASENEKRKAEAEDEDTAAPEEEDTTPEPEPEEEDTTPEPEVDDIDALPEPEEELPEEDVDTSGYDDEVEEDVDWDDEVNPLDAEPDQAPEERTTDDILSDIDSAGERVGEAISNGSDDDLNKVREDLLEGFKEARSAINSSETSNDDKVKLQNRVEETDRAISAIDQEIESRNSADDSTESGESDWIEDDLEDIEGVSDGESQILDDGAELQIARNDANGLYYASAFPPASDTDVGPEKGFKTKEEARQAAQDSYNNYDPSEAATPETFSEEDLANGHQADPQPVDESASAPDVEQVKQANQDAAENGTFDITEVDSGADFTETSDITERRENAGKLQAPEIGDTTVTASGRTQEYVGNGVWKTLDAPEKQTVSNDTQKKFNKVGPEPIRVGSAGEPVPEAPVAAPTNKHNIDLKNGPTMVRATLPDGTEATFQKHRGRWHRRLDNAGNLAPSPITKNRLNDFLNNVDQVASVEPAKTVKKPKVKETPAPEAPQEPKEKGLAKGGKSKHKASGSEDRTPLGSDITDKITSGEPDTILTQNGARVGYVGPDGTPYYVGDRVIYQDRSKRTRSVRIAAIGDPDENGNYRLDAIPDEHDIFASENKMPYDEWRGLSNEDRVAAGMSASKYANVASFMSHKFAKNKVRHAQNENKDDVNAEHQRRKEEGKVTGVNVEIPKFHSEEEASRDRVLRDESTRIIGTLNKHGEEFKPGEVVTYGPNNEVGTIVRVGEADDVIRIAPNGQSALEAQHYHVDTIAHSNKPATYYDENYDALAHERVIYDRFNDPVRVGDTIYRYGLPFTVKDIFPDGRKMRVVGQDWAGEQGSTPAVQFSKLIEMGMDEELAKKVSSESEHDFMPEHLQLFTGDVNDIRSIRTHDSHMWSMVRDDQGRVIESHPENRAAAQTRATGNRNDQKILNAQWARDMAERPEDEVRLEYTGIQPGQFIDQVFGQAVSDNYSHYIDVTFGTDMVIPDNSRLVGQDRFGNPEFYIKKNNRWRIEGIEDDAYEMSAAEFGRYRMRTGYDPGKDFEGDVNQRNKGLVYMGVADEEIAPKPGQRLSKKDAATFKLMPIGSVVRFEDAEGNMITIRKGPDGEWYKTTQSGAWAGNAKPVDFSKIPGKGTYRGPYNRQAPLPAQSDRSSEDYEKNNVQRQKLRQERNVTRRGKGGEDRIYGSHITGEGTYRDNRENSDNVRDSRIANEQLAAENERLAAENQAAQEKADQEAEARLLLEEQMRQMQEEMRRLRGESDEEGPVTASGDRIIATRKGTDHVLAVYNRVDGNVWEYTSEKGYRREFTMENVPSTPGVTYKVEEKTA